MMTGAIIGAAGSIISNGVSIYKMYLQSKIDQKQTSEAVEVARINADRDVKVASYGHDTGGGQASQWVIDVLRLVRPVITLYAMALVTLFWFGAMPQDQGIIVAGVLEMASMAISWWFGDRCLNR